MRNKRMYIDNDTRFKRYMRRTWHNKLVATGVFMVGVAYAKAVVMMGENDITFSIFLWVIALAMFFARTDWREL